MKYMIQHLTIDENSFTAITIDSGDGFTGFPAEKNNPNYIQLLDDLNMTEDEFIAQPENEWIEA